jgi:phage baseplate assembly protein V
MSDGWALQTQIDRLYRRIRMMVAPTKILATDDTDVIHKVQLRVQNTPEILDSVGVMQIYGLASHAPVGTDATALFVMGDRSNPVVIATGQQKSRLKNQKPGEISLYTDEGDTISMQRQQNVAISTKTATTKATDAFNVSTKNATINGSDQINLTTPNTTVSQDLTINQDVKAHGKIDASGGFFQNGNPIGGGSGGAGPPGPAGPAGPAGPQGATGAAGNSVLHGSGSPAGTIGNSGDFYIDTGPYSMFGPKTTAWPTPGTSLIGPQGLTGPQGTTGPQGPQGATGAQGPQGPNWNVGSGLTLTAGTPATLSLTTAALPLAGGTLSGALTVNLNTVAPPAPLAGTALQLAGSDGAIARMQIDGFSGTTTSSSNITLRSARGGLGTALASTVSGDALGGIAFRGYGTPPPGTGYSTGNRATMNVQALETFSDTQQGTAILLNTTAIGGTQLTLRLTIAQGLVIGAPSSGGDCGPGTINLQAAPFVNGVQMTYPLLADFEALQARVAALEGFAAGGPPP